MRSILIVLDRANDRICKHEMGRLKGKAAHEHAKGLCERLHIPHLTRTPKNVGGVRVYLAVR
jgi:hypothetical protein